MYVSLPPAPQVSYSKVFSSMVSAIFFFFHFKAAFLCFPFKIYHKSTVDSTHTHTAFGSKH